MADWQFLLRASIILFISCVISFRAHIRTPKHIRENSKTQPFIIILLVAVPVFILAFTLYLFSI